MLKFSRIGALVLGFVSLVLVMSVAQTQKNDPRHGIDAPTGQRNQAMSPESSGEQFNVKMNVDLVTADVTAYGENVPVLKAEDFVVYDNDVAQQINYFSQDQLPLAVAIVIDCSGSISDYLQVLKIAGLSALRHFKPQDEVALFGFASKCHALSELTKDRTSVAKAIGNLDYIHDKQGGTHIYGSLYEVAQYLKLQAPGFRRAIIVITDNCEADITQTDITAEDSRIELLETSTTLYDIVTLRTHPGRCQNRNLRQIAEETGGAVTEIQASLSIKNALGQSISKLRTQYTLGFNPSDPGVNKSFHELKVLFKNRNRCPDCRITARKGYYSGVASLHFPLPQLSTTNVSSPQVSQELIRQSVMVAGTSRYDFDEISFKLSNTEKIIDDQSLVTLNLEINPKDVNFETNGGRHDYRLLGTFCYFDKWGKSLGSDSWMFSRSLGENAYQEAMTKGIQHSVSIPLKMLKQITKIVIYDEVGDRISSRFISKKGNKYVTEYCSPTRQCLDKLALKPPILPVQPRRQ